LNTLTTQQQTRRSKA